MPSIFASKRSKGMIFTNEWVKETKKNKDLDKNIDFHFLDLTVTFYAFDFNPYDCSPDEVNGGYGVVP